ncbi:MAG: hypothetical protein ACRCYU_00800 [Nocardioides sp.]
MTATNPNPTPAPLIHPFPTPGELVRHAYSELHIAINGTPEQQQALGNHAHLPRPWEPATCLDPELRHQLWAWLDDVVTWLNHDYTWDATGLIPTCWPHHPHLTHEIAVLADQRRRAGLAKTSDALEEWHRYSLPAFTERMRTRLRSHCDHGHQPWPARPRHTEHTNPTNTQQRHTLYTGDIHTLLPTTTNHTPDPHRPPRLGLVDLDTGEIHDPPPPPDPRTRTPKGPRE